MSIKNSLVKASVFVSVYGAGALPAFAQDADRDIGISAPIGEVSGITPGQVIRWVFNLLIVVAVVAALIWLLIGGVKWVISGGDKEKIESARKQIVAALVGLIIVILAFVIFTFVLGLLGVELGDTLKIPTLVDPESFD
jgi:hypothetical protein